MGVPYENKRTYAPKPYHNYEGPYIWGLGFRIEGFGGSGLPDSWGSGTSSSFFIRSGSAVDDINPALPIIRNILFP